jgi:cobalt transporter subunit CbtA
MIFRRIIYTALLVGLLSGLIMSVIQITTVNPIIFAAESYESERAIAVEHEHGGHNHSSTWAPEEGAERTSYTIFANVSAGIGFAAILLALMSQLQLSGITQLSVPKGILWGVAGFVAVFVAPAIGLPPEIPGIEAAAIEQRQLWWTLAVIAVAVGLLILSFAPLKYKVLGLISLVIPYIVTIPHHQGPAFAHPDPSVVEALTRLHEQFLINSAISNLVFWLALGVIAAWALNRWTLAENTSPESTSLENNTPGHKAVAPETISNDHDDT